MNPALDLATYLAAQLPGLTLGTNLFAGPMPEAEAELPDQCVALIATGGNPPQPYLGGSAYLEPTIQIRIRGTKEDFEAAQSLAQSVWDTLNLAQIAGYALILCDESAPSYFGPDQSQRHRFSFNVSTGYSA